MQCFQKAFELDEREDQAAKILASEFAITGDWDLVEVIARRVVQITSQGNSKSGSERMLAVGTQESSKYAWAWKAIGAADLVYYALSCSIGRSVLTA